MSTEKRKEDIITQKLETSTTTNLLSAKESWDSGEWQALVDIDIQANHNHPDVEKLAALKAAAYQQLDDIENSKIYFKLAKDLGCDNYFISQLLVAGIHNSLGRVAALKQNNDRMLSHFTAAVDAGGGNQKTKLAMHARSVKEVARLGLLQQAEKSLSSKKEQINLLRTSEIEIINPELRDEKKSTVVKDKALGIKCNVFPRVICLTLPEQRRRQLNTVKEFQKVGIASYEFFIGYQAHSKEVIDAFSKKRIKSYPNCFRCGERDCGKNDCNNILLPEQVSVALGYQNIFKTILEGDDDFVAVCEDDIVFSVYARSIMTSENFERLIVGSGIKSVQPTLIQLSTATVDKELFSQEKKELIFNNDKIISNSFFLVNKSFAKLAYQRLEKIDHTASIMIHDFIANIVGVKYFTLKVPLATDGSSGLMNIPSLVLPTLGYVGFLKNNKDAQASNEANNLHKYQKKAISRRYSIIGSPRCGSHYVSSFLKRNGLDIGHEKIGKDGVCAWQYTVDSDCYPYIDDKKSKSSYFLYFDELLLYVRNPLDAIPSLIIENQYAPLSYSFRRDQIKKIVGVNLDSFSNPVEKAIRSYVHWYQIALARKPMAILRVENFLEDCQLHFNDYQLQHFDISKASSGAGKLYLGAKHKPKTLEKNWEKLISKESLSLLIDVSKTLGYKAE